MSCEFRLYGGLIWYRPLGSTTWTTPVTGPPAEELWRRIDGDAFRQARDRYLPGIYDPNLDLAFRRGWDGEDHDYAFASPEARAWVWGAQARESINVQ